MTDFDKLKIGDLVKVTKNKNYHGFEIGTVVEIVILDEDLEDVACVELGKDSKRKGNCWMQTNEFEPIKKI